MKKVVIFDLDDTLLDDRKSIQTAFDITCGELAEQHDLDAKKIEKKIREVAPRQYSTYSFHQFTKDIGMNPFEGLWGNFTDVHHHKFREMGAQILDYQTATWVEGLKDFGISEADAKRARDRFKEVRRQSPFLFPETIEVLDKLKDNGIRMFMLTNGSPSLQLEKLAMTPELIPYFEQIIISGNIGFGKPDVSLFAHVIMLIDTHRSNILMVGDNLNTDILGASQVGIENAWLDLGDEIAEKPVEPTYTINKLGEILDILKIN